MNTPCVKCKWAEWERTKSGRLHPNGNGRCRYVITMPAIPRAVSAHDSLRRQPPHALYIDRTFESASDCPTFAPIEKGSTDAN